MAGRCARLKEEHPRRNIHRCGMKLPVTPLWGLWSRIRIRESCSSGRCGQRAKGGMHRENSRNHPKGKLGKRLAYHEY